MPNAILRAGPFATFSDSFVDEPGSATQSTVPVNCAMNNWTNDEWKLMASKVFSTGSPPYSDGSITYVSGPTVSQSTNSAGTDSNGIASCGILFEFRTQAAVAFDIKVSASASTQNLNSLAGFEFFLTNGTPVIESGLTFSNSQTVTIQPSVLPITFGATIDVFDAAESVSATLSVEPA